MVADHPGRRHQGRLKSRRPADRCGDSRRASYPAPIGIRPAAAGGMIHLMRTVVVQLGAGGCHEENIGARCGRRRTAVSRDSCRTGFGNATSRGCKWRVVCGQQHRKRELRVHDHGAVRGLGEWLRRVLPDDQRPGDGGSPPQLGADHGSFRAGRCTDLDVDGG
jgi:hypothetical protein